jgi:hypothetical protein
MATFSTWYSNSAATSVAVSWSSAWLMVAIIPMSRSFFMTSLAFTPMARARSATVTTSEIRMTRLEARGTVISVFFSSLPGSARRFCGRFPPRSWSRAM